MRHHAEWRIYFDHNWLHTSEEKLLYRQVKICPRFFLLSLSASVYDQTFSKILLLALHKAFLLVKWCWRKSMNLWFFSRNSVFHTYITETSKDVRYVGKNIWIHFYCNFAKAYFAESNKFCKTTDTCSTDFSSYFKLTEIQNLRFFFLCLLPLLF